MKKLLFLAICLFSLSSLMAQTYTAGHIHVTVTDSMSHDSTTCTSWCFVSYNITIDSSFIGDSVTIVDTSDAFLVGSFINYSGASPWNFTTSITNAGYGDIGLVSGGYVHFNWSPNKVTSTTDTLRYITTTDSLLVTDPCSYGEVTGYIYADNNNDCIFDSTDQYLDFSYGMVVINETLSSYVDSLVFPANGWSGAWYNTELQQSWMTSYTVSFPSYFAFIFPFSSCFSGSYTFTTLPQLEVNFPVQCTSNVDVQCWAGSPSTIRLHRPFYMQPYVSNTGCDSASGQMTLVLDSRVTYDSSLSSYLPDTVRGDTLIWNYSGLSNLSSGAYWNSFFSDVYLTPASTLAVGDTLCFRVYTNIPTADVNPANNDYTICLPVVYSYDPNLKEVSPTGTGTQGYIPAGPDTLTYTLHFQNTGSDVAENISITDTLDSHINASSLRILGTSFNMTPQWLTPHVVQFNFNEINLPDSFANEAGSQGEVRFSVALNTGLPYGTQIKNTGYIYFDANPAVVTNTTLNTIQEPNRINQLTTNTPIYVYPNPATDNITVEGLKDGEISILNMNGSIMIDQDITSNKTTMDVSSLPGGVYILKTVSNSNTTFTKFTKY